jgi:acyl-coenzyme A synthetase/AMP-(fatty) acid ligase
MKRERFGFGEAGKEQTIVATVPPQHMYGLETSILNPLINGVSVYTNKTFFPADIFTALNSVPEPRVLITTPIHMKACVDIGFNWPKTEFIISATAPLDKSLATRSEAAFNCPVLEIYGCTEAGSLASRRNLTDVNWTLYKGSSLKQQGDGCYLSGPNLPEDVLLHDIIELVNSRQFTLHGRNADMINIAGKRASLEDLNIRLRTIEGIQDAAFIVPEPVNGADSRLAALVVAPSLDEREIRTRLALRIDQVFLPRPLYLVEKLPRNETGKLPRTALLEMLNTMRNNG